MGARQKIKAWARRRALSFLVGDAPPKQTRFPGPGAFIVRKRNGGSEIVDYTDYRAKQSALISAATTGKYKELGVTGLEVSGGRILDDYNSDLQVLGTRMARFEEMRRSDSALAVMENLTSLPVREAPWRLEGGDDDKFRVRLWEDLQDDMSHTWDELLRQALLAPLYGFEIHEVVSEVKADGFDGVRKFAERARQTVSEWDFDETGGVQGFWQEGYRMSDGAWQRQYLPIDSLVIWTWREDNGNPEGMGIYRQAYKHYYMKTVLEEAAAIRVERSAVPIPVWTPPAWGASDADMDLVLALTDRMVVGENVGVLIPAGWTLTFEWAGGADVPWMEFIQWEHMSMLQSVLGQFVGFGSGGGAAGAPLGRDASDIFLLNMNQMANWICGIFNRHVIPKIWLRNKGTEWLRADSKKPPKLAHGRVGLRDMDKFGRFVRAFLDKNTMMTVELLEAMIEISGLPPQPRDALEEIVAMKFSSGAGKQGGAGGTDTYYDQSRTMPENPSAENGLENYQAE